MSRKYNIAIVGATGNVGRATLSTLAERNFPVDKIFAIASSKSIGKEVSFGDQILKISSLENFDFTGVDIAFFSAGSLVSEKYSKNATDKGCIVIDKSSHFRMDPDVPLIVPEVNLIELKNYSKKNIIANPNCCAVPLCVALKPLDNAAKIVKLVISTYQSVSGAGQEGMTELYDQTKSKYLFNDHSSKVFSKQIAFNVIPLIGEVGDNGISSEERKITEELNKILGRNINTSITCARVPVFIGHSMSVNVTFEEDLLASDAIEILSESDGITVHEEGSLTPVEIVNDEMVFVSRIRNDAFAKNSLNLWVLTDNLYKGAALNAVQIAEELINHYL